MSANESWVTAGTLRPLPSRGSVVLFDLRTRHRGSKNRSDAARAILYMSYVKDWFIDRINFRGYQSVELDGLGDTSVQKLLRRIDTRNYVAGLQAFAAGDTPEAPRSAAPFLEKMLTL